MAPMPRVDHDDLERQLKDTIQSLYQILVQVSAYGSASSSDPTSSSTTTTPQTGAASTSSPYLTTGGNNGNTPTATAATAATTTATREVLASELSSLSRYLSTVHATSSHPNPVEALPHVPPELIQYVENGRNPDIYTREFVELVRRGNQLVKGKQSAFAGFRDVLAEQMNSAMPELRADVDRVLAAGNGTTSSAGAVGGAVKKEDDDQGKTGGGEGSASGAGAAAPAAAGP